ncbi:MAG: 4-diphosphocytidyl-2-C-methyl-D-erythritol kinase, partial [Frankiales bacterium]|nr:4-diphosphocytidyl-2-C-methyl-D-erythritol kinase [Frankiales bacterium]
MTIRVAAKINIFLGVGPRGHDGFHEIATIFHALDLYDTVTVSRGPAAGGPISLTLTGPESAGLSADETNLAWRAAVALRQHVLRRGDAAEGAREPIALGVDKAIPIAAGLAGGSADAAGALVACDALWRAGTPVAALGELAAGLGSDVTFALQGGTALGAGRGERLSPVPVSGAW